MIENPYVIALLVLTALLNTVATVALVRDAGLTSLQKLFQSLIIWLVPIIGGVSIFLLVASHHARSEMKNLVPFPFYLAAPARGPDDGRPVEIMNTDLTSDMFEAHCGDGD